jgi:hypothetical protein
MYCQDGFNPISIKWFSIDEGSVRGYSQSPSYKEGNAMNIRTQVGG